MKTLLRSTRVASLTFGLMLTAQAVAQDHGPSYQAETDAFRARHVKSIAGPDGWLTVVGLEWLHSGVNTVGSGADNSLHLPATAPAHLASVEQAGALPNATLRIAPPAGGYPAGFSIGGQPATPEALPRDAKLQVGTYTMFVIERGDRLGLRIKDENAPGRVHFSGLKWYPADEKYRIKAKWVPYPTEHAIDIGTVIGTTLHEKVPGYAEFSFEGQTLHIEPVVEGKRLFFILRDKTSLTTTYGASRFLYADFPSQGLTHEGEVLLDLNQMVNPPCAYTDFATCPLPPAGNRLNVAIPAGEKRYHD